MFSELKGKKINLTKHFLGWNIYLGRKFFIAMRAFFLIIKPVPLTYLDFLDIALIVLIQEEKKRKGHNSSSRLKKNRSVRDRRVWIDYDGCWRHLEHLPQIWRVIYGVVNILDQVHVGGPQELQLVA